MFPNLPRTHGIGQSLSPDDRLPRSASIPAGWRASLRLASRACCCAARPAVVAVMPSAPGRPHRTDLLLCRHHYRTSRQALAAAGAVVFDPEEAHVNPQEQLLAGAHRGPDC